MGALTSKPYAFVSRPWELKTVESIDVFDSYLSSIRYDYRGTQVLRVLPSINSQLNSEWITDKVRFHYDAITHQRLSNPWIKSNLVSTYLNQFDKNLSKKYVADSILLPASWIFFLEITSHFLNYLKVQNNFNFFSRFGLSEGISSLESSFKLSNVSGSNSSFKTAFFNIRSSFSFDLDRLSKSEICFLVNLNTRLELPLLNLKLRELVNSGEIEVFVFGSNLNLNFSSKTVGYAVSSLYEFFSGRGILSVYLLKFINPFFIFGVNNKNSLFLKNLLDYVHKKYLFRKYPFFMSNLSFNNTTSINLAELGKFQNEELKLDLLKPSLLYLVSYDGVAVDATFLEAKKKLSKNNFVNNLIVYSGSHGDYSAEISDLVAPITLSSEFSDIYLNLELKVKNSKIIIPPLFNQIRSLISFNNVLYYLFKNVEVSNFSVKSNLYLPDDKLLLSDIFVNDIALPYFDLNLNYFSNINNNYLNNSVTRSSQFLTLAYNNYKQKFKNFKD